MRPTKITLGVNRIKNKKIKKKEEEVSNAVQWICENICMGKSVVKKRVNEQARKTDFHNCQIITF